MSETGHQDGCLLELLCLLWIINLERWCSHCIEIQMMSPHTVSVTDDSSDIWSRLHPASFSKFWAPVATLAASSAKPVKAVHALDFQLQLECCSGHLIVRSVGALPGWILLSEQSVRQKPFVVDEQ